MSSVATPADPSDETAARAALATGSLTETLTLTQRRRGIGDAVLAVAIATVLSAVSFVADGGLRLGPMTTAEVGLIVGCATIVALALAGAGPRREQPLHGAWALAGLAALTGLTALSIGWSLAPADSWLDTSRMLAYLSAFAAAIALVRMLPGRTTAVLHGVALASVVVCGYAMLTKVAPGWLAPDEQFARLREPFGYWNGIGLMAALGVPPLIWLAARRSGHAVLNALAYPGLALVLATIMLSFSRGALVALVIGLAVWFTTVPLRLRGAAALLVGAIGCAIITLWAFTQDALTEDRVPLDARENVGAELGLLLVLVLGALFVAGLTAHFVAAQSPPSERARWIAGRTILGGLLCIPLVALIALAAAPGGIDGQISKGWESMTAKEAKTPPNSPDRLTATASVRSRYWREALDIWEEHKLSGAGAGSFSTARLRYRTGTLSVRHAHGYIVQTLADLGLLGLLLSLATLAAFLAAAARAAGLRARRRAARAMPYGPERIALLTMFSLVVVFGVHAAIDWTWSIPGTAITALLCAGWLAGRGPLFAGATVRAAEPRVMRPARPWDRLPTPPAGWPRTAGAVAVVALALTACWSVIQPQRAVNAADDALAALDAGDLGQARASAVSATERNPLSVEPMFDLAAIQAAQDDRDGAIHTLERAAALQPANPAVWRQLGRFQLLVLNEPRRALPALRAAYYLDPRSPQAVSDFLEVLKRMNPGTRPSTPAQP